MTEQERFEEYWCNKHECLGDDYWLEDGAYGDDDMQEAWEVWQAAQHQWISVDSESPTENKTCIALITESPFVRIAFLSSGKWYGDGVGRIECVKHWMYLPLPPAREDE